uniref:Peptidase M54 n=1 Tax=candidate division WOR-3 bacterium TaxID=2052148 RepID=A0A7V1EJ58_UNCW3
MTSFIYNHRGNFFLTYDGECYLCCAENIIDPDGCIVAGLAIWNTDPSIQREAACAIATQYIQDQWINQNPPPATPVVWYIAWASAHELGHCFCLYHCNSSGCIMNGEVNVAGDPRKIYCVTCSQTISINWP